jgi:hypothetical protein
MTRIHIRTHIPSPTHTYPYFHPPLYMICVFNPPSPPRIHTNTRSRCKFRLEGQRREYTKEGRSWRHVADAAHRNDFDLLEAKGHRSRAKSRYGFMGV